MSQEGKEKEGDVPVVKKRPNRFVVDENDSPGQDDPSIIIVNPASAAALGILINDAVLLRGRKRKETSCVCLVNESIQEGTIKMNRVIRDNLSVRVGDVVSLIVDAKASQHGVEITLAAFTDSVEGMVGNLKEVYLTPYFLDLYRPVHEGDIITCHANFRSVDFQVVKTEPSPFCIVAPETVIKLADETLERQEESQTIGYGDIGGCRKQLGLIREMIELPIRHPQLFKAIGIKPPRGILLHGPPGTGKTMIGRAVATETGAYFFLINGPEIVAPVAGKSEENLREAFAICEKNAPAVLFIDEIDAIAPKREKSHSEVERRLVSQLLTLMDGIKARKQVVVIGATNCPNDLDGALRRFGRFDREIDIGVPDIPGRMDILQIHTKNMKLDSEVDLEEVAKLTHGYVGADLRQVCTEAAMNCIREKTSLIDLDDDAGLDVELLNSLSITQEHFKAALKKATPSALRQFYVEVPNTTWDKVGGLADVKKTLKEMVQFPLEYPQYYEKFKLTPPRAALLFGPPGCGKTLIAKAIATESQANFLSIKGPELLTKWFGESESNVRDIFDKARQCAPCVLFFDELDSIGRARGTNAGDAGGGDRVLNALLCELDGVESRDTLFVVGATNRVEVLDDALIRPGRFDKLVYIPLPDKESRLEILKATLKDTPVSAQVDLEAIADRTGFFSGADLAGVCQNAVQAAIADCIAADIQHKKEVQALADAAVAAGEPIPEEEAYEEPVAEITWDHFRVAIADAKPSVKKQDLERYDLFQKKFGKTLKPIILPDPLPNTTATATAGAGAAGALSGAAAAAAAENEIYQ